MSTDWFKEAMNAYLPILESNIREELEHMSNTTNNNTSTETTAPKFKVGDRVTFGLASDKTGTITSVVTRYYYEIQGQYGDSYTRDESYISGYAKLSEEDAWLEVALTCGTKVEQYRLPLNDSEAREIRHRAYQILGGNGIRVTEDVKARVRSLIERAKRV